MTTGEPGAQVLVDGAVVGTTPMRLDGVAVGQHVVEVRRGGDSAPPQVVVVGAGALVPIAVTIPRTSQQSTPNVPSAEHGSPSLASPLLAGSCPSVDPALLVWRDRGGHELYLPDRSGHLIELWGDGLSAWTSADLTAQTSASTGAAGAPAIFLWRQGTLRDLFYRGQDNHLHETWHEGTWHDADLTGLAGASSGPASDPAAFLWTERNVRDVFYRGQDRHLHETWWDAQSWHDADLTRLGGAATGVAGKPSVFLWEGHNVRDVFYRGEDSHLHETWWDAQDWHDADLTRLSGAATGMAGEPSAFPWAERNVRDVFYRGQDGHLHETWWDAQGWHDADLTRLGGAATGVVGDLSVFLWEGHNVRDVFYRGGDSHLHETWWDAQGWHDADLSVLAHVPVPLLGDPSAGFTIQPNVRFVYFRGTDGRLYAARWSLESGWQSVAVLAC